MNSLYFPNRCIPRRPGKFKTRFPAPCTIKSRQSRASHSARGQRAPASLRYEPEIVRNGAAGHEQPGLIRNDAQSRFVRITPASCGTQETCRATDGMSVTPTCAEDDHVRVDEGLKLLMSKSLRALNERSSWSVSRGERHCQPDLLIVALNGTRIRNEAGVIFKATIGRLRPISTPSPRHRPSQPRRTAPTASSPGRGQHSSRTRRFEVPRGCGSEFCRVDS
jgi:hypothetical protein